MKRRADSADIMTTFEPATGALPELHRAFLRHASKAPLGEAAAAFEAILENRSLSEDRQTAAALGPPPPKQFLRSLRALLQELPPEQRREVIASRLSFEQRLQLEHWMLSETKKAAFSEKSLCRLTARGRVGFRPSIHVACGFYIQAAFSFSRDVAVARFGLLLAMRCLSRGAGEDRRFAAVREVIASCGGSFYFKTRIKVCQGCELCSPTRSDLQEALEDWQQLYGACTGPGERGLERHCKVKSKPAEQRARLCRAWSALWEGHSKHQRMMAKLPEVERLLKAARPERKSRATKAEALLRIERLLLREQQRQGRVMGMRKRRAGAKQGLEAKRLCVEYKAAGGAEKGGR